MGLRQLEVLSELELAGGSIISKKPWLDIKERSMSTGQTSSFKKTVDNFLKSGALSLVDLGKNGGKKLTLTSSGVDLIAYLKAHPEFMSLETRERRYTDTSDEILKCVHDFAEERADPDGWAYHSVNDTSVLLDISAYLEKDYDVVTRRINELAREKGYFEPRYQEISAEDRSGKIMVNIRLTPKGLDRLDRIERYETEDSGPGDLIDEELVEEASVIADSCIMLARELGHTEIADAITEMIDNKHFFEMTQDEFDEKHLELQDTFGKLRQLKIATNGNGHNPVPQAPTA